MNISKMSYQMDNTLYWKEHSEWWYQQEEAKELLSVEDIEILNDALEYSVDEYHFASLIEHIVQWSDHLILNRVIKWIDVLNNSRGYVNPAYSPILLSLLELFKDKHFFIFQTEHQFNITKSYVKLVLGHKLEFIENKSKSILLITFLIAQRPDLMVRSFKESLTKTWRIDCASQIFEHLFIEQEMPKFLIRHLDKLDREEMNVLIAILDGHSLRKVLPETLHLTKKENAILHENHIELSGYKLHILERYTYFTRILKHFPSEINLLYEIINSSKIFRDNFSTFKEDLDFWISIFQFIVKSKDELAFINELTEIIDFFEQKRYYDDVKFKYSLKGRRFKSIRDEVMDWHYGQDFFSPPFVDVDWKPSNIETWFHIDKKFTYQISEITNGRRLREESQYLKHCVFSYLNSCCNGSTHIFSLSKIKKNKETYLYTIEVRDKKIIQVAGKLNSSPTEEVGDVINLWAKENGIANRYNKIRYLSQ